MGLFSCPASWLPRHLSMPRLTCFPGKAFTVHWSNETTNDDGLREVELLQSGSALSAQHCAEGAGTCEQGGAQCRLPAVCTFRCAFSTAPNVPGAMHCAASSCRARLNSRRSCGLLAGRAGRVSRVPCRLLLLLGMTPVFHTAILSLLATFTLLSPTLPNCTCCAHPNACPQPLAAATCG